MKPKKIKNNIKFIAGDVEAIICALPLVANAEADTFEQTQANRFWCEAAATKLLARSHAYALNELRVMSAAIDFALDVIRGTGNEFVSVHDVDDEWKAELSRNLFAYNRLKPGFDDLMIRFESNLK